MGLMEEIVELLREHWGKLAVGVVALLVLGPAASSAMTTGDELIVAANAPRHGETMSITVASKGGLLGGCDGEATVEVLKDDIIEYSSTLGTFEVSGCRGSFSIPYAQFADENGQYLVRAHFDGKTAETRVTVEKVVNWVYVRSFEQREDERTRIDVAFDRAQGQPLTSSVFSSGTLVVDITWERCSRQDTVERIQDLVSQERCSATGDNVFHAEIPVEDRASTHIFIPWENLDQDDDEDGEAKEGWYNVTATYHNDEAQSNNNVPMDPTVYNEDPPGNWFEVRYE